MPYNLTQQEIFDKVVNHLYTQRKQSTHNLVCMYRSNDGLKCAVGILIDDEDYIPEMDNTHACTAVSDIVCINGINPQLKSMLNDNMNLLESLQLAHDRHNNWNSNGPTRSLYNDLIEIAGVVKLSLQVLRQYE